MEPKPFYFYCPDCGKVNTGVIVPKDEKDEDLICATCSQRHVEVISIVLDEDAARLLTEELLLETVEKTLAAKKKDERSDAQKRKEWLN